MSSALKSLPMPILWSRPEIVKRADCIQSSDYTWTEPPKFEHKGPQDMNLLMQHYYGRAWHIAKRTFDEEKASIANLESSYIERRCIMKAKIYRQKRMAVVGEKPRYVYPKFRNVAPRINTNLKQSSKQSTNRRK